MATAYLKVGRNTEEGVSRKAGEIPVFVTGAATESAARTAVIAQLVAEGLTNYDGNTLDNIHLDEVPGSLDQWEGAATFAASEGSPVEVGEESEDFSTTGGTAHVTTSRKTQGTWKAVVGASPTPISNIFGQAIGYDRDGNIAGTDIGVGAYEYKVRRILSAADVNTAYRGRLFRLTFTYNLDTFRDLLAGENLFKGAEGGQRSDGNWDITYYFSGSPNVTSANPFIIKGIGPDGIVPTQITVDDKLGWDYLWVYYMPTKDAGNGLIVPNPQFAIVEQVYEQKNHAGASGIFI